MNIEQFNLKMKVSWRPLYTVPFTLPSLWENCYWFNFVNISL